MIYLTRYRMDDYGAHAIDIAACETEKAAARYDAQGYERVDYAVFRAAWQARDEQALRARWAMERKGLAAPIVEPGPVKQLPAGYKEFHVSKGGHIQ